MLKRNDLVKQFELVVQQEIKNHNDAILASNIAFNELKELVLKQKERADIDRAYVESSVTMMKIEVDKINASIIEVFSQFRSLFNDSAAFFEASDRSSHEISAYMDRVANEQDQIVKDLLFLSSQLQELDSQLQKFKQSISSEFSDCHSRASHEAKEVEKRLLSRPSEMLPLKKELEQKISEKEVDVQGVLKEIRKTNQTSFVLEKKIENIYTLIDRINKRLPQ